MMTSTCSGVDDLEEAIRANAVQGGEQSKNARRKLVDVVITSPPENSENEMRIEVRGYLSRLYRRRFVPTAFLSGGKMIAEEESNPDTRILIRSCST